MFDVSFNVLLIAAGHDEKCIFSLYVPGELRYDGYRHLAFHLAEMRKAIEDLRKNDT